MATGPFPGRFVMAFGYRLGYRRVIPRICQKIVMSRSTEDTQIHNSKTDWFCTRNPYTEVFEGIGFLGRPPIGYQCLAHDSPLESNLCIRNFLSGTHII